MKKVIMLVFFLSKVASLSGSGSVFPRNGSKDVKREKRRRKCFHISLELLPDMAGNIVEIPLKSSFFFWGGGILWKNISPGPVSTVGDTSSPS